MQELDCIAPLFVPASRPALLEKAAVSRADAIIIDLEDAVGPDDKDTARAGLRAGFCAQPLLVRINKVGTRWHLPDIEAVKALPLAGIMLPKAEFASVQALADAMPQMPIVALIETAHGLSQARQIAAHPRVGRLAFGSLDYALALGCAHTREALLAARSELVLACALAAILPPLDGVTLALKDAALAEADARHAAALGFTGKLCVHPQQIEAVVRGFTPQAEDIAWARKAAAQAQGASQAGGMMVDAPVRLRAQAILDRYERTAGITQ